MNDNGEEKPVFEMALVLPKRGMKEGQGASDCVEVLVDELRKNGLVVESVTGLSDEFLKVAAPLEALGRAAAKLHLKKRTQIGMDLPFELDEAEAFVRQPDGALFSWCERFHCYNHLIYGLVNNNKSAVAIKSDGREIHWEQGESLVQKLKAEGVVKQVFPLHDESKRKQLLQSWALNWWGFTEQPIDEIYSYFGPKIAIYFAFLGMYTKWILFPAALGLTLQLADFGSSRLVVLPVFFMVAISWAVLFFQFWKRKNSALLTRWLISYPEDELVNREQNSQGSPVDPNKRFRDKKKEKHVFQRDEWFGYLMRFRNDVLIILGIICLQLPFELVYAHLYEVIGSDVIKFALTAVYLLAIQYFTKIGGKVAVKLIKHEKNENTERRADSLVYKVFGLYFMQSYIGVFYHALFHRNFTTLRQLLIQRLIVSQVLGNLVENSLPFITYSYKKYRAVRNKKKRENGLAGGKIRFASRVEKEYLKPVYSASIGDELEDGLFDDFLELVLEFGMVMMFVCAFPLAFAFAAMTNITEIRTDALKLLVMFRRPVPRAAARIGAWHHLCQFLIVMSICTNSVLLACLYDHEGKWKIEPGLAVILVMEHILLFIKFGFSRFFPEEPAWVRANRVKSTTQAQEMCSKQLLRSISCTEEKNDGLHKEE